MSAPLWVFGDQLGPHVWEADEHRDREIVLVECSAALRRRRFHRQKLHLMLSGMRHLAGDLGDRVRYVRAEGYREALGQVGRPVLVHEPTSRAAERFVYRLRDEGVVADVLPTPTFALSRSEFAEWAADQRRLRMEEFYRGQRHRFGVLLEPDGAPVGGQWNLDRSNRERPPRGQSTLGAPPPWQPVEDGIDQRVRADLDRWGMPAVGADGPRRFAVTRAEAQQALAEFIEKRLAWFGPYEDAMLAKDWAMAHSLLSVPLNLGLLHPLEAVHAAEDAYRRGAVQLRSAEGFIRQVLGWREYIWHLYWHFGEDYRRHNALDARTPLPRWWTDLRPDAVEAACLRDALHGVTERGWVHHIQRLMVLGNHALQRGYDPDALTEWYQTAFVDGFDWVMPPNVIGMSQHADGGLLATKPYAAGGAYINRMSDYCRRCPFDPTQRVGERACPFTAGYWAWVHRNADRLARNHRTSRAVAGMRRLPDLDALLEQETTREHF